MDGVIADAIERRCFGQVAGASKVARARRGETCVGTRTAIDDESEAVEHHSHRAPGLAPDRKEERREGVD